MKRKWEEYFSFHSNNKLFQSEEKKKQCNVLTVSAFFGFKYHKNTVCGIGSKKAKPHTLCAYSALGLIQEQQQNGEIFLRR